MLYRILFFGLLAFFFFWGTSRGDSEPGRSGLENVTEQIYLMGHP